MYAEERQEHILRAARSAGRVEVTELAAELDVAPETIRKDLTALERVGVVRRVHGGAIPVERLGFEPAVAGLRLILGGGRFDNDGHGPGPELAVRLLGWSVGKHWLLA